MAKSVAIVEVIALVMICMLVKTPEGQELNCTKVTTDLLPCLIFVKSGGKVSGECCSGLKTLINSANTKAERQTDCLCIKEMVRYATDEEIRRAASVPNTCRVVIPFVISRNMDCSKVNI